MTLWLATESAAQDIPDERVIIHLVTVGAGSASWQAFGHNAIWVQDKDRGFEAMYNFGLFDFEQENFLLNFVRGLMSYRMAAFDPQSDIAGYINDDRRVTVQTLNLTSAQKQRLITHLETHRRPENSSYRYDYFRQNCSTKVRDALDLAVGGQLQSAISTSLTKHSFRTSLSEYSSAIPWMHVGANLALGRPVDPLISSWDLFYLPDHLQQELALLSAFDSSDRPLVGAVTVLHEGQSSAAPWAMVIVLTALVGTLIVTLVIRFRWAAIVWASASGIVGCLLLALWLATDHWAAGTNPTIAALSPLLLVWVFTPTPWQRWLTWLIGLGMVIGLAFSQGMVQQVVAVIQLVVLFLAAHPLLKTKTVRHVQ